MDQFSKIISENAAVAAYFSTEHCNVCKVLKPKLKEFISEEFPKIVFIYIDIENEKELAATYSIFAVPTIIFFFDGKEAIRKSRNFGFSELELAIERPYKMLFS
jgi:thiol-disulfide isomerase/thioredoxin